MAIINITEFSDISKDSGGNPVLVGDMSIVIASSITTFTTAASKALDTRTRFIRVIADADAYIIVGDSPTATASDTRLEANVAEYFGVQPKGTTGHSVSIYDGTS